MTKQQRRAASFLWWHSKSALHLVAGAGSGKTTTLVQAVLESRSQFNPERVVLLTFSRKAAAEMRARLLARGMKAGFVGTIHALAWRLIRHRFEGSQILENREQVLSEIVRDYFPQWSHIPASFLVTSPIIPPEEKNKIFLCYEMYKKNEKLVDFDDIIHLATELEAGKNHFDVLFIDEFQDTSPDQLAFIKSLKVAKLFAVGDDWQSIYKFRGADVNISLTFSTHFPDSARLFLTKNFRSSRPIVSLSNKAIKLSDQYIPKRLRAKNSFGEKVVLYVHRGTEPYEALAAFQDYRRKISDKLSRTFLVRTNTLKNLISPRLTPGEEVLTIHAAKGLEFDHVVVFGIAPHIMPHRHGDHDEEVRILYVAMTRARKSLAFVAFGNNEENPFFSFLVKHCTVKFLH
ncbi:MAG: DEAD/DEAH box helicase [Leptospiraceae bacterium]|nr:DEAD/DEAH box helicase [Leptospiraceae bacterium]MDW8306204.1 DEAD/DEAH box helicase [Leptospiraceae bacterium]